MGFESLPQDGTVNQPADDLLHLAVPIEEQERDMGHAVSAGQGTAFGRPDVGHPHHELGVTEGLGRAQGFALQGAAGRALRIMDLHHDRNTVADHR